METQSCAIDGETMSAAERARVKEGVWDCVEYLLVAQPNLTPPELMFQVERYCQANVGHNKLPERFRRWVRKAVEWQSPLELVLSVRARGAQEDHGPHGTGAVLPRRQSAADEGNRCHRRDRDLTPGDRHIMPVDRHGVGVCGHCGDEKRTDNLRAHEEACGRKRLRRGRDDLIDCACGNSFVWYKRNRHSKLEHHKRWMIDNPGERGW